MAAKAGAAREEILAAADRILKARGASSLTVEAVAKEAGSAKGLVLYHFKTKRGLLDAAAEYLTAARQSSWETALGTASPVEALDATWELLTDESETGTLRAWYSLIANPLLATDRTIKKCADGLATSMSASFLGMVDRGIGAHFTVPDADVGGLLSAAVDGIGLRLATGGDRDQLEGVYAAAWAGILSFAGVD